MPVRIDLVVGLIAGSILPDADTPYSPTGVLFLWTVFKHRRQMHSVFAMMIISLICALLLGWSFAVGIFAGYGLHLFMDRMTPMGLPYLWFPFKYNKSSH